MLYQHSFFNPLRSTSDFILRVNTRIQLYKKKINFHISVVFSYFCYNDKMLIFAKTYMQKWETNKIYEGVN